MILRIITAALLLLASSAARADDRVRFNHERLDTIAAVINAHNPRIRVIIDPSLSGRHFAGSFNVDDIDWFIQTIRELTGCFVTITIQDGVTIYNVHAPSPRITEPI